MSSHDMSVDDVGIEVIAEMDREFHNSPDRVIAVIGAAYLDSMLDRLLTAGMISVLLLLPF